jgi:glyoxylase-like metal-dependent hydrolase (beta-lactamase superfamily II)
MQPKRPLPPEFDPAQYQPNRWGEPSRLLNEGEIIDLGGFRLEVVVAPAHTHGSICLLDRERRMLLTGDTIHDMVVWLHLDGCPAPEVAYRTYERLAGYADVVDYVLPAHGTRVCSSSLLTGAFAGVQRIWAGEIEPVYAQTFAGDGWRYDLGVCQLLFKERIVPA